MPWLILAIAVWGAVHSLLASTGTKDLFRRTLGERSIRFYRLFYNIFAIISFLPVLYLMLVLPDQILYAVPPPYGYLLRVGQGISLLLLMVAALQTDLLAFVGLRQLIEDPKASPLMTGGLYRFVRHPLYTFSLLFLWLSPTMSLNSLVVYFALTVYVLVGIVFEERKLLREFGQAYAEYRATTPMLLPGRKILWNK